MKPRFVTAEVDPGRSAGSKKARLVPYEFVLETLAPARPFTHPMFGCLAVYIQDKIMMLLRKKESSPQDNGVWLATTCDHHSSLREQFPSMRSITVLGRSVTGWQVLPEEARDFEESALLACRLILAGDPRIGKIPKHKSQRRGKKERVRRKSVESSKQTDRR